MSSCKQVPALMLLFLQTKFIDLKSLRVPNNNKKFVLAQKKDVFFFFFFKKKLERNKTFRCKENVAKRLLKYARLDNKCFLESKSPKMLVITSIV